MNIYYMYTKSMSAAGFDLVQFVCNIIEIKYSSGMMAL